MRTISQLLAEKPGPVAVVSPGDTVLRAVELLDEHHVGALVVTRGETVVGIFSERDLVRRVVVRRLDPAGVRVEKVMTTPVFCCQSGTTLDEVRTLMRQKRIRHVPVVDEGHLVGIVSIGDLNIVQQRIQEETILYLEQFIYRP